MLDGGQYIKSLAQFHSIPIPDDGHPTAHLTHLTTPFFVEIFKNYIG
jgi:hypothetical protein